MVELTPGRRILLLGPPRIEVDGQRVNIGRRKAVALLAYLLVEREPQLRERLAALFWADADLSRGLAYLRTTLWTLNQALGEDWALLEQDTVTLNPAADLLDDVSQFNRLRRMRTDSHVDALREAVSLYRGDFLSGFNLPDAPEFEQWQTFQAEGLRQGLSSALGTLIVHYTASQQPEAALDYARRFVALDPLHEPAQRALMYLYMQTGQRAAALRQYQELVRLLETELQTTPEAETAALYETIRTEPDGQAPGPFAVASTRDTPAATDHPEMPSPLPPANLPHQTTPFFGRQRELSDIAQRLADPDCRLLTVVGPGGTGKTRLAVQAAQQKVEQEALSAYFVPLSPLRSADLLLPAIFEALTLQVSGLENPRTRLFDFLRDKHLLLVLDNFEHLLSGADTLSELLAAAPGLKMLVTSRERLNLREEWLLELRGLDYPIQAGPVTADPDHQPPSPETYSAVRLFLQGARQVRPGFTLTDADLPALVRICRLVDGMPLALELAAAWTPLLTIPEIASEIQRSLDFLSTTTRNIPERHRSLRAVFEHSWTALAPEEQACLRRLSVFHGAFNLAAAQAISWATLHLLLALTDKSLIRRTLDGRYEIHELLRQFAESKLSPEEHLQVRDAHASYYGGWLANLIGDLKGPRQGDALDAISLAFDDLRGAWSHAVRRVDWQVLDQMLQALLFFGEGRYRMREVNELVQMALDALESRAGTPDERLVLARLLSLRITFVGLHSGYNEVLALTRRLLVLLEEFGDHPGTILPLLILGGIRVPPGRSEIRREPFARRAIALSEQYHDLWGQAFGYLTLGWICQNQVRYADAREMFLRALDLFRQTGQPWGQVMTLNGLEENYRTLGEYKQAEAILDTMIPLIRQFDRHDASLWLVSVESRRESYNDEANFTRYLEATLAAGKQAGDKTQIAWSLYHAAWLRLLHREYHGVETLLNEAYGMFVELGDTEGEVWSLVYQGMAAHGRNDLELACRRANQVFERLQGIEFPWAVAGAHYLLGDVALTARDLEEARSRYTDAVSIAYEVRSILQVLRHLTGLIDLMIRSEDYEQAFLVATFITEHPIITADIRNRVTPQLTHLREALSPALQATLTERAARLSLDDVVAMALAGVEAPG